jgi:hypothetical protein
MQGDSLLPLVTAPDDDRLRPDRAGKCPYTLNFEDSTRLHPGGRESRTVNQESG